MYNIYVVRVSQVSDVFFINNDFKISYTHTIYFKVTFCKVRTYLHKTA